MTASEQRELRLLEQTIALLQARELEPALSQLVTQLGAELHLDDVVLELAEGGGPEAADAGAGAVEPGGELVVALRRGPQIVGHLRARARGGLTQADASNLARVCEGIAVAVDDDRLLRREQETVATLRELDVLKGRFLGSITHELRTTVTIVEGFAMLLSRQWGELDEAQRSEFVARIWRSARTLGTLVEDLLDVARLDAAGAAGTRLHVQPVDLSELVPKIIDQVSPLLVAHDVTREIDPGVVAACSPWAIERILVNLLSNAAKYTPPGTAVTVALARRDAAVVLAVADAGPGIPAGDRERIFERFFRAPRGEQVVVPGIGIGLALVRDLVDRLGGTVTVDETPGGGATFEVVLPGQPDAGAADG